MSIFVSCRFNEKQTFTEDSGSHINMRLARTGNNFWSAGHTSYSSFGLRSHSSTKPKVKVAPYTRLNQVK